VVAGDLSVSFEALASGGARLVSLAGQVPERVQAWCEDVGSAAVAAAVEEWALWFSTDLLLARGEVDGLAAHATGVAEAMQEADGALARVMS